VKCLGKQSNLKKVKSDSMLLGIILNGRQQRKTFMEPDGTVTPSNSRG